MMARAKRYGLNVPSQALLCFGFCLFMCLFVCDKVSLCSLVVSVPTMETSLATNLHQFFHFWEHHHNQLQAHSLNTWSPWCSSPQEVGSGRWKGDTRGWCISLIPALRSQASCLMPPDKPHCAVWLPTTKLFTLPFLPWWPVGFLKPEVKINLPWLELLMSDILSRWREKQLDTKLCLNSGSPVDWLREHGQSNKLHSVLIP